MSQTSRTLVSVLFLCMLLPSASPATAGDVEFTEIAKRVSSDLGPTDAFGFSAAIDGDTMVVGALNANGPPTLTGAAYIFVRNQGGADGWQEVVKLTASDASSSDDFGNSVSISGDLVVVGARESSQGGDRRGSAYVFARNQGGADAWGEVAKLTASDAADVDNFGNAVGIHGDTVVVGSPNANVSSSDNGAMYVFGRNVGGLDAWGEVTKLTGPSIVFYYLGNAVAIEGDIIVGGSEHGGAVHLFKRNEGGVDNWGEIKVLTGSASSAHRFGASVSISGDRVVTGGRSVTAPGAAWIFDRNFGGIDTWGEVKRVTASDGSTTDSFGGSISIIGDRMLVGARQADATATDAGAAYVFERNSGGADNWGETQQLLPSDAVQYAYFGWSVALGGATAIVGASSNGGGAAYVFASCGINASDWTETAKTVASDAFSGHQYARDIAFNGDIAVIGARMDNDLASSAGAAYILMRNQGGADNWGELKKIHANDGVAGDQFGERVAMSGDLVLVGVDERDDYGESSGAVYLFARNEDGVDNWGQVNMFTASDASAGARFGHAVAIDSDTFVVGAWADSEHGTWAGAAYVFKRNQGGADNWGEVIKLTSDDLVANEFFGFSVAVSGDTIAVGAARETDGSAIESGAAYIFERNFGGADNWGRVVKLKASDAATYDYFGSGLDLDGDTLVVGSPGDDNVGFSSGSAYVFERDHGGADNWGEVVKLTASDAADSDAFGTSDSISINEDVIVFGVYHDDDFGLNSGSTYVFERNFGGADNWGEAAKFSASDASYAQNFGNSVDLENTTIMVAASNDAGMGSVYFFDAGCPEFDFGDAPDPDYATLLASNGAFHKLGGGVYMGATVDMDLDGQPTSDGDGDDNDADGDDEDGVTFNSPVVTGGSSDVDVIASDDCRLDAWIDFNNDGDWDDTGEQIFTDEVLLAGTNSMVFAVPLDTDPGEFATARFRVSTAGGLSYDGGANDGEVEDHQIYIEELDYGDAPDPAFPTLLASDGARHILGGPLHLGGQVDAEIDGLPSVDALGDDTNNLDDEDGVVVGTFVVVGTMPDVEVIASAAGLLNAWVDFNADGDWLDAGEQIFTDEPLAAGTNPLAYSVPSGTAPGILFARFRVDSAGGLSPTGLALDGEVEDHIITAVELDYGDAPDPSYQTLDASSGAAHILGSGLYLGASVDAELDGQPTAGGDGDDLDGNDDEDGVVFTSGIGAGLETYLDVTASGPGLLNAWVDFNSDGDWADAGEQVFTDQVLVTGANSLSFAVPAGAVLGTTFARFRLNTSGGLSFDGLADDGEVEDHMVEIVEGPDLQIDMVGSSHPVASGHPLTYTITVTNNGPLPATSVTVTDTLPAELIFVSSTPGGPDCTYGSGTLSCDLGAMAPSDTSQITIETVVDYPEYGGFSNSSSVAATETDPISANNTATVDTIIALFVDGFETGDLNGWD